MQEWVVAGIGFIGVILGAIITAVVSWLIHRSENKDRYRVMTFEKRLEAHQRAYYWWQRLNEALNIGDSSKIYEITGEAREWWNGNCLLLDSNSRESMLSLLNRAEYKASGDELGKKVWDSLIEAKRAIVKGIGSDYLPEVSEAHEELRETM